MTAIVLLAGTVGLYYGVNRLITSVFPGASALPFKPEQYVAVPHQGERIAVGPLIAGKRQVLLVSGSTRKPMPIGHPVTITDAPLTIRDLPRATGVLVAAERLPARGVAKSVPVGKETAMEAAGGEPNFQAFLVNKETGLIWTDYRELAAPLNPPAPTGILVDTGLNALWYYDNGKLIKSFHVATGKHIEGVKPTAANQEQNYLTPLGIYTIGFKAPGMYNSAKKIPSGPLGTRWLGFSVYPGDKAAVWGIHGTDKPEEIGSWVTTGCIRLKNEDAETLYAMVAEGTRLEIINSHPTE